MQSTLAPDNLSSFEIVSKQKQYIGRFIKKSKRKLRWKIRIDNKPHELICTISKLSGKRKVHIDNELMLETKIFKDSFKYEHQLDSVYLILTVLGDQGELVLSSIASTKINYSYADHFLELSNKFSADPDNIYGEYY